jgi:hypothetical protein
MSIVVKVFLRFIRIFRINKEHHWMIFMWLCYITSKPTYEYDIIMIDLSYNLIKLSALSVLYEFIFIFVYDYIFTENFRLHQCYCI